MGEPKGDFSGRELPIRSNPSFSGFKKGRILRLPVSATPRRSFVPLSFVFLTCRWVIRAGGIKDESCQKQSAHLFCGHSTICVIRLEPSHNLVARHGDRCVRRSDPRCEGDHNWTTGLPFNVDNGFYFPTDWQLEGTASLTGPLPQTGTTKFGDGVVNVFPNPQSALASFSNTLPGSSGIRNVLRQDGFFTLDGNLAKRWIMPWSDKQSVQFRWEVFNIPNANRFSIYNYGNTPVLPEIDIASSFGNYTQLLTNPRVMQFVLRYEF